MRVIFAVLVMLMTPPGWAQAPSAPLSLEERRAMVEALKENPSPEQLARKGRSSRILTDLGVPQSPRLPVIAAEAQTLRRTSDEVAKRALALMIVAVKGETRDQSLTENVIAQYGAMEVFTPAEWAFIRDPNPPEQRYVEMTWRYEGAYVLLWATGFFDELARADQIVDASVLGNLFFELGTEGLLAGARLRPQAELLDMADLAYRMDWAVTEASINNRPPPAGLHPGIVYERHYALNWLYGYAGLSWDDMRTDT